MSAIGRSGQPSFRPGRGHRAPRCYLTPADQALFIVENNSSDNERIACAYDFFAAQEIASVGRDYLRALRQELSALGFTIDYQ